MEEERSGIIKAITTPLGFFALSLLIVEGFLGIVLGFTEVENQWFYFLGMGVGAFLFVIVVVGVWALVWFNPENIVLAGKDYIELRKLDIDEQRNINYVRVDENTTKNINVSDYINERIPAMRVIGKDKDGKLIFKEWEIT